MTVGEQVEAERHLSESLEQYAGQWIAVVDHDVQGSADSLNDLLEQIPKETLAHATVFQVPEDGGAACYF
jgi:hypothetical protein